MGRRSAGAAGAGAWLSVFVVSLGLSLLLTGGCGSGGGGGSDNPPGAPLAVFVETPGAAESGDVTIAYRLRSESVALAGVRVEFSLDGGRSFRTATERPGSASEGTSGLAAEPGDGALHFFV